MAELVSYAVNDQVATIVLDDGKVNVLSPTMQAAIHAALDRAESDGAVPVIAGREGMFSAGFDLKVIQGGGEDARAMVTDGFVLAERLLTFPTPVVMACTGHAIAMAVFLLLAGDHRVGADGPFRVTANEVAIGMTMPRAAIEMCHQRLTPAALNRAVLLAEVFSPADAVGAGFLDQVVAPSEVVGTAQEVAARLAALSRGAHFGTKTRVRADTMAALRAAIDADDADMRALL